MYIYIYIYYIVIKEKNNNIFKMKIFRLLALSIHNISLYEFRFEGRIRLDFYRARYKVVLGTTRTRFNFYNKDW